jgi:hypothetical protein
MLPTRRASESRQRHEAVSPMKKVRTQHAMGSVFRTFLSRQTRKHRYLIEQENLVGGTGIEPVTPAV